MKRLLRRILRRDPNFLPMLCYSQEGEDLVLYRLLEGKKSGFYVDVGAHHPMRFSNTYLFYLQGWDGLNIDAEPGSMELFRKFRPRDRNIESGVGSVAGELPYFRFNEPALNTFCPHEAERKNAGPYRIIEKINVGVRRLDVILAEHLSDGKKIDFLTVDVEGRDLDVLKSNDWERFRPTFVLAETLRSEIQSLLTSPIATYLDSVGYRLVAKTYNTTFFQKAER